MRKAIAIDFDGCLCSNAYPEIGAPNWGVIERAKRQQRAGAGLILWSCREGELLDEAVNACASWGLAFAAVNESLPDWIEAFGNRPRKVGASEYWDDRAVRLPDALLPNEPLTLDELQAMEGEPAWIAPHNEWMLVDRFESDDGKEFVDFTTRNGRKRFELTKEYGETWTAYRRKPKCSTS